MLSALVLPQAWQASVPTSRAIGQIQKEVSQVLGQLLVPQRVGQLTEDGLFLLDICVAGQRVALELDGPEHYLRNTRLVTGRSLQLPDPARIPCLHCAAPIRVLCTGLLAETMISCMALQASFAAGMQCLEGSPWTERSL